MESRAEVCEKGGRERERERERSVECVGGEGK
jgi:hypothetical protein